MASTTISEPTNARSRRTRAALLAAAHTILEEQGFEALTMSAVADRAGVTRRAVYMHFTARAELVGALFDHVAAVEGLAESLRGVWEAPDAVSALDQWAAGELADKPATAFTSAINRHGGNESTLLALYNTMHHWGAIVVAPGYTHQAFSDAGGNPYGTAHPSGGGAPGQDALAAGRHQGRRLARIAALLGGAVPAIAER